MDTIEAEIQAKGLTAPRVTPADIEASIVGEYFFTAGSALKGCPVVPGLELLTFCILVLRNGTKIVGINYGAIDPAQHNAERGRVEARAHAVEQVWPLLGYALRENLHNLARGPVAVKSDGTTAAGTDATPVAAPKIIPPTIGRRVWYWPSDYDRGLLDTNPSSVMTASDQHQPCDAGIAYVWGDRMVNLTVADHNGVMHARTSVKLLQEGDPPPFPGEAYAQWMPYQVGQAKK